MTRAGALDRYLAEVGRRLGDDPRREDILDELGDHLAESLAAHRRAGLDEESAAAAALAELGEPGPVATAFRPVAALRHSRECAHRLVSGGLLTVACGAPVYLLLGLATGSFAMPGGALGLAGRGGGTAVIAGIAVVVILSQAHRVWAREPAARRLLGVCVGAGWLIMAGAIVLGGAIAVRTALALGMPLPMVWAVAGGLAGAVGSCWLARPLAGTGLLLAACR